jgi:hypothetical protein
MSSPFLLVYVRQFRRLRREASRETIEEVAVSKETALL